MNIYIYNWYREETETPLIYIWLNSQKGLQERYFKILLNWTVIFQDVLSKNIDCRNTDLFRRNYGSEWAIRNEKFLLTFFWSPVFSLPQFKPCLNILYSLYLLLPDFFPPFYLVVMAEAQYEILGVRQVICTSRTMAVKKLYVLVLLLCVMLSTLVDSEKQQDTLNVLSILLPYSTAGSANVNFTVSASDGCYRWWVDWGGI